MYYANFPVMRSRAESNSCQDSFMCYFFTFASGEIIVRDLQYIELLDNFLHTLIFGPFFLELHSNVLVPLKISYAL